MDKDPKMSEIPTADHQGRIKEIAETLIAYTAYANFAVTYEGCVKVAVSAITEAVNEAIKEKGEEIAKLRAIGKQLHADRTECWGEIATLKAELARIKDGIKRVEGTMIVDGNDMYDWGWTPSAQVNNQLFRMGLHPFSYVGSEQRAYDWEGKMVFSTPTLRTKIRYGN